MALRAVETAQKTMVTHLLIEGLNLSNGVLLCKTVFSVFSIHNASPRSYSRYNYVHMYMCIATRETIVLCPIFGNDLP